MIKKISITLLSLSLALGMSSTINAFKKEGFVTFNIAVSQTDVDQKMKEIELVVEQATTSAIPITFFLDYDQIKTATVASYFKKITTDNPYHRLGMKVSVGRTLLEDTAGFTGERRMKGPASVSLASYSLADRLVLIEQMMKTFFTNFGSYPSVILEDYIDSRSLTTFSEKYGVVGAMFAKGGLSDYINFEPEDSSLLAKNKAPYYPRKINSTEAAVNENEKLDMVISPFDAYTGSQNDALVAENLMDKKFNEFGIYNPSLPNTYGSRINVFESYRTWLVKNKEKYTLRPIAISDFSLWYMSRYPYFTATFTWKDGELWNFFSKDYWITLDKNKKTIQSLLWWRSGVSERWWMEQNQDERLPISAPFVMKNQVLEQVDFEKVTIEYQRIKFGDQANYLDLLPFEIKSSAQLGSEKLPFVEVKNKGNGWVVFAVEKNNMSVMASAVVFILFVLGWYGYKRQAK